MPFCAHLDQIKHDYLGQLLKHKHISQVMFMASKQIVINVFPAHWFHMSVFIREPDDGRLSEQLKCCLLCLSRILIDCRKIQGSDFPLVNGGFCSPNGGMGSNPTSDMFSLRTDGSLAVKEVAP